MIILSVLFLFALIALVTIVLTTIIGGAGFIIVFADVIVAAAFIVFVVKRLINK